MNKPFFPVRYTSQLPKEGAVAVGMITLKDARNVMLALDICEQHCPHHDSAKRIVCSGIDSSGVAHISVAKEDGAMRRSKWLRFRFTGEFNAPCGVTYDKIRFRRKKKESG